MSATDDIWAKGRLLECDPWEVPTRLEVDGADLRWRSHGPPIEADLPSAVLAEFLDAARDERLILDLARRLGPLTLVTRPAGRLTYPEETAAGSEPLELWSALAHDIRSVLTVAVDLRHRRPVPAGTWASLRTVDCRTRGGDDVQLRYHDRYLPFPNGGGWAGHTPALVPALFVDELTAMGGLSVGAVVADDFPLALRLRPHGLLAALGLQMVTALAGVDGLALCSNPACPDPIFTPTRRPRLGRSPYCKREACKAAGRAANKRAERARTAA